ncbi:hypothetical protein DPMN_036111 [Dreissena polymorpha]|uniref:Uncharacterized protein n=1 Tax=Dreissena polymorpha TaxID=45954 RepID=A0A9D4MA44_DREPO|nr:hypothetical protein DPMN_036111 [Dreissena polymorpha]
MKTFWPSGKNKTRLQYLLRTAILLYQWQHNIHIVVSRTDQPEHETPCVSVLNKTLNPLSELNLSMEEADVRMIPHAVNATAEGSRRCVIISGDTDVDVLALHFFNILQLRGLQELRIRAGIGNSTRYIPLHKITQTKPALCKVLIAAHILTGCDMTSKVGTKLPALNLCLEQY